MSSPKAPPHGCLIKEITEEERPRERLVEGGSGALSDAELVAVLLRCGCKGMSALEMARALLREHGGLSGLVGAKAAVLRRPGLGDAKVAAVLAAVEIGRRLARDQIPARRPLG